jgi:hypothetical protein
MPEFREVPISTKVHPSKKALFYHLVRGRKQRLRDSKAERLGGLQVDGKFELGRLLDRKIGRPFVANLRWTPRTMLYSISHR